MATQDRDEALNALERYQVVAGPIQTIAEVMEDPHVLAREAIAKLLDDELGPMRMPAPVPKLSETPGMVRWTGGRSGEHNEAVFEGLLGLSAAEIDRLAQAGVI